MKNISKQRNRQMKKQTDEILLIQLGCCLSYNRYATRDPRRPERLGVGNLTQI